MMRVVLILCAVCAAAACDPRQMGHMVIGDGGDAYSSDGADDDFCNPLTQTGCNAGEKCSWVHLQLTPVPVNDIECAPDGTVGVGGACSYGQPPQGWDNCTHGSVCHDSVCKQICDQQGGAPMCNETHACVVDDGFLGPPGSEAAGVCEPSCDPLADNDFLGSGVREGSACGSGQGCYGFWSSTAASHFTCSTPGSTVVHRSLCDTSNGCANSGGTPYLNGCASGYMPEIADDQAGMNTFVCLAFCKPADCNAGQCGSANDAAVGAAPHRCTATDARGTFDTGSNGDQCVYGWWFEVGTDGHVLHSQYSDTTGFCLDHSLYHLADRTGMNVTTTPWPACSTLPLTAAGSSCYGASGSDPGDTSGCTAVDFGCVSTTTGGVPTARIRPPLRAPYRSGSWSAR